jgi:hypothetical protein
VNGSLARPWLWGLLAWLATLLGGVAALVLADFGAPAPLFGVLGLWLCTVGLPTTAAVLLVASVWGPVPGLGTPSLRAFVVCAATLGLIFHVAAFVGLSRLRARRPA